MPDRRLIQLIGSIAFLNAFHTLDHIVRGDFHWPMDGHSLGFLVIIGTIYLGIALGLYLYRTGLVGPLFWMVIGGVGFAFGWLSHFSPMTDQPAHVIFDAYASAAAGALAVGCLFLLMLTVLLTTVYAGYLWATEQST